VNTARGTLGTIPSNQRVRLTGWCGNARVNLGPNPTLISFQLYINSFQPGNLIAAAELYKTQGSFLDFILLPNDLLIYEFNDGNAGETGTASVYGYYL
jgi:hypothetical protein